MPSTESARALEPRSCHKDQIRKIVAVLDFPRMATSAKAWLSISGYSKAHQRPFLLSPAVDDDFRARWHQPFDMVVRGLALALTEPLSALMRRVEQLAAMKSVSEAVKLFENEIPGALPLQWHFYENLKSEDWPPHLVRRNLIGEPLLRAYQGNAAPWLREWPAGRYLLLMAKSSDPATGQLVAKAVRDVAGSKHPDVYRDALQIIAALPPDEAATLADVAIGWLQPGSEFIGMQAPQDLVRRLAEGGQQDAALSVARALLQLFEQNGDICSLYTHLMYEHHLPRIMVILTGAFGDSRAQALLRLLTASSRPKQQGERQGWFGHQPLFFAPDRRRQHGAARYLRCAHRRRPPLGRHDRYKLRSPSGWPRVIAVFESYPQKIFVRIALHVLAKKGRAQLRNLRKRYLRGPGINRQPLVRGGICGTGA